MSDGGTYALVISLPEDATLEVGALGQHSLPKGGYTYTGSALGPGGFRRVDRHRRVARGDHEVRHWHVDYLTGYPESSLVGVERAAGVDRECLAARELASARGSTPIPGFGASDCDCPSHLSQFDDVETAIGRARTVFEQLRSR